MRLFPALRYIFRLCLAFFQRFKLIVIFGVVIGIIFSFFFIVFGSKLLFKKTDRIAITGRYAIEELPAKILNLVSQGLTMMNPTGQVLPSLAEKWETPDQGKTWIFHLKPGSYWQDTKEVTAQSIRYKFEETTLKVIDKKTLQFNLKTPFAAFPASVAKPTFKKGLLGTGDWKVVNLSLVSEIVSRLTLENKGGERIIYKFYPTEERSKLAFKLGEVDSLEDIIDPEPLNKWPTVKVIPVTNNNRYLGVFFNTEDSLLEDKSLRQALSYAIDKSKFTGQRALGPISSDSWVYNPQIKTYDYDPLRANEIIKDLAIEVRSKLKLKLVTSPLLLNEAEKIAKDWEKIGVKTSVLVTSARPEEYQAYLAIYDIQSDPDQYATWHSTQTSTNISRYRKNTRVDKLLEDGRLELNSDNRKKIYLDFQRFLLEDSPAAFIVHPITYKIERK